MPNWCECTLYITGPEPDIAAFVEAAQEDVSKRPDDDDLGIPRTPSALSFERLLPTPVEKLGHRSFKLGGAGQNLMFREPQTPEEEAADDWWTWRVRNWGTKWDINAIRVNSDPDEVLLTFDSAWSPPLAGLYKISEMFPTLKFAIEFDEPGMDFWGVEIIQNGKVLEGEDGPSKIAAAFEEDGAQIGRGVMIRMDDEEDE